MAKPTPNTSQFAVDVAISHELSANGYLVLLSAISYQPTAMTLP